MIDEATCAALARLTENEKECLHRRLRHQTAKEMALDLEISPHAVEKRLKMARAKLGLSSSLEAAQLLAEFEGYQRTGPQPSDLETGDSKGKGRLSHPLAIGAIAVSLSIAALIVFAAQAPVSGGDALTPKPGEVIASPPQTFEALDKDHSGYLEGNEAPAVVRLRGNPTIGRDEKGNTVFTSDKAELLMTASRKKFYAEADTDGDGRISPEEFRRWSKLPIAGQGGAGEVKPATKEKSAFELNREFNPDEDLESDPSAPG